MIEMVIIAAIASILTLIVLIAKKNSQIIAKIKDIKPWDEYLYQAYVELEEGKTEEVFIFSKHPLRKNFKVILERKGEKKLFTVKKIY
jgi:hypothetical protein